MDNKLIYNPFKEEIKELEIFLIRKGEAFLGFKIGKDFHYIRVPYTEPSSVSENIGKHMLRNFRGIDINKILHGDINEKVRAAKDANPDCAVLFNSSTGMIEITPIPIRPRSYIDTLLG